MTTITPPSDDNHPTTEVYDDETNDPIAAQSVPDNGEGGKLKTIMSLLKKCLGVKDIAAMYTMTFLPEGAHVLLQLLKADFSPCFIAGADS